MADNVLQTLQPLAPDVIAPEVRELKVRGAALEKFVDNRFTSLERQREARFKAIMAAIGESRAQAELATTRAFPHSASESRLASSPSVGELAISL